MRSVLFATGFRPFFLLAGFFGALWIPAWVLIYSARLPLSVAHGPVGWHSHEMLFGYTSAVLAGFLLTAARNWTRRETASGYALAGLVATWIAGRVAMLLPGLLPPWVIALVDLAFLPVLAATLARPILGARSWRNLGFVPLLLLMGACNALIHLGASGGSALGRVALQVCLDAIVLVIAIVGGRIIPLFTRNALGCRVRERGALDTIALASMVALIVVDAAWIAPPALGGVVALAAGALQLLRMRGWGAWASRRQPLLAVLHLGHGYLGLGLLLLGFARLGLLLPLNLALHSLTLGAVGVLTMGMMSRVALGHSGRPLELRPAMAVSYLLLYLAAPLRVIMPLCLPRSYLLSLELVGGLWSAAFLIFIWIYTPILVSPRADGAPG